MTQIKRLRYRRSKHAVLIDRDEIWHRLYRPPAMRKWIADFKARLEAMEVVDPDNPTPVH